MTFEVRISQMELHGVGMETNTVDETNFDLGLVKRDLLDGIYECSQRGLHHTVKWLSELNFSLGHIKANPKKERPHVDAVDEEEMDVYLVGKSYFDVKEYDRCSYYLKKCVSAKVRFLYLYSRYLSIEKKKLDAITDVNCPTNPEENEPLKDLCVTLKEDYGKGVLDGFGLYLYGIVLKKLDLGSEAFNVFVKSVIDKPMLWAAWQELTLIMPSKEKLLSLTVPDHWMKQFFFAHAYLELLCNDEARNIYRNLHKNGFSESLFVLSEMATIHHNKRELMKAIDTYKDVISRDPYRLDNLDTYSNLLYVHEMKSELADLAHKAVSIEKYRVETCCIIGNYYSIRSDHAKAVLYFQRALKLNPHYSPAWTLMGHEFMEMKNTNAAIQSYRHALEINNRDYRAWYGLGQTYEIIKMPYYSIYYYKQAQHIRPQDSRMVVALGEMYEKLEKLDNALKCFYRACYTADVEGMAFIKLAKLYERLKHSDNAAAAYTEYCIRQENSTKNVTNEDQTDYYSALQFLSCYHMNKGDYDSAYTYASKCLDYDPTKESGKALLKTITMKRAQQEAIDEDICLEESGQMVMSTSENVETM